MASNIVSRVAEFIVGKATVEFVGFIEPTATRRAGRSYGTLATAIAVTDLDYRNTHDGARSPGVIPGTIVARASWDTVATGIHRNGIRKSGRAVTTYRNGLNARRKAELALIKRFEAVIAAAK